MDSPNPNGAYNYLNSVVAVSEDDVWAVGYSTGNNVLAPLIEHWDGADWITVTAPSNLTNTELVDIDAISSDDVWAVGGSQTLHWDGIRW